MSFKENELFLYAFWLLFSAGICFASYGYIYRHVTEASIFKSKQPKHKTSYELTSLFIGVVLYVFLGVLLVIDDMLPIELVSILGLSVAATPAYILICRKQLVYNTITKLALKWVYVLSMTCALGCLVTCTTIAIHHILLGNAQ